MKSGMLVVSCIMLAGCGARRAEVELPQCTERSGELAAGADAATMVGEYRLTLVATRGERAGNSASGDLMLIPVDSAYRIQQTANVTSSVDSPFVLVGRTELSLGDVGAIRMGEIATLDPTRPGVAVLQQETSDAAGSRITLRFGSQANQLGNVLFDGGYTALQVSWIEALGFGGSWASGVRGPETGGYFCAFRITAGG